MEVLTGVQAQDGVRGRRRRAVGGGGGGEVGVGWVMRKGSGQEVLQIKVSIL